MANNKLVDHLTRIVANIAGSHLNDLSERILAIVTSHDLQCPPQWMAAFIGQIANGVSERTEIRIPTGYPDGENGIANILADIQDDIANIGIEDYGEGWVLESPELNVSVYVNRENGNGNLAVIAPYGLDAG